MWGFNELPYCSGERAAWNAGEWEEFDEEMELEEDKTDDEVDREDYEDF